MSTSALSFSDAAAPFDHQLADVILRSSDNIDFRVFKLFLSLASPVFETMFGLPQPSEGVDPDGETKDGLPVVPVSEDSKTLDVLLRFCYPSTLAEDPSLENFTVATEVLEAAKKYSLDAIERLVSKALFTPEILEIDSFPCFVVARRAGLREQCALAAEYSLRGPLIPTRFEGIQLISSIDLLTLLTYHQNCANAVLELQTDLTWIRSHYQQDNAITWMFGCGASNGTYGHPDLGRSASGRYSLFGGFGGNQVPTTWWEDFMNDTFMGLRDRPCAQTVEKGAEDAIRKFRRTYPHCTRCPPVISDGMQDFVKLFKNKVEEATAKVSFIPFTGCHPQNKTATLSQVELALEF